MGIIQLAYESGAKFIYPAFGVTLRENQRLWYYQQLDKHFPGLKQKYIKDFGNTYECRSSNAEELWQMFSKECNKRSLLYKMKDIIFTYKQGYGENQLSLF